MRVHAYYLTHNEARKAYSQNYYQAHHDKYVSYMKDYARQIRLEVFKAYGGFKCVCCGETNPKFLTIDHINGCTRSERKEQRTGWLFHQWLKKHGYPPGYQVLCYNCNLGRARNNGICPHKITITV